MPFYVYQKLTNGTAMASKVDGLIYTKLKLNKRHNKGAQHSGKTGCWAPLVAREGTTTKS